MLQGLSENGRPLHIFWIDKKAVSVFLTKSDRKFSLKEIPANDIITRIYKLDILIRARKKILHQ